MRLPIKLSVHTLQAWLPLAVVVTGLAGLNYLTNQQGLRQGANDPQLQLAQAAAYGLTHGHAASDVLPNQEVDISDGATLTPFVIIYDQDGNVLASSASIKDLPPVPPKGVFSYASQHGRDVLTWMPNGKGRFATVVVPYSAGSTQGYVLSGRSLYEVERREEGTFQLTILAWVVTMAASLLAVSYQQQGKRAV